MMQQDMSRVNRIWEHPVYQNYRKKLDQAEEQRKFCRHTVEHFLDVARLTYLFVLEQDLSIAKEVIYGAALLHDIGRLEQYERGIPHEEASAQIAAELLPQCGYAPEETAQILEAIRGHRKQQEGEHFSSLLYRADKMSRNCFSCPARGECNWSDQKKNHTILY